MTSQQTIPVHSLAQRYYGDGYGCAEAALLALADVQNIRSPLVPKMATVLCGGLCHTGGTCGALTGAALGLSLGLGRSTASDPREALQAATQQLVREFEQAFGHRNCSELEGLSQFGAKDVPGRLGKPCAAYTGKAAEIAARLLEECKSAA